MRSIQNAKTKYSNTKNNLHLHLLEYAAGPTSGINAANTYNKMQNYRTKARKQLYKVQLQNTKLRLGLIYFEYDR